MKSVVAKTLVVLAGVVLVVPFVAAALLVGAAAIAGAGEGSAQNLLLVGLAAGGALFSGAKGLGCQKAESGCERSALHLTSVAAGATRRAFLRTSGY